MRKLKQDDIKRGAILPSEAGSRANTSLWRFGEWLSRTIWRSCSSGMWTISRDGKLGCEPLCSKSGQPE